ncbi:hypothetical protein ACFOY4_03795 [Actinomadura syzygii]|uniref:Uncharacterized protein n=1 Tax=Actinomadura syzygii TaxID=1427538 RepID=A0A5D0TY59_9ACTN|nr:hypothetical protein [Actinomadura syzygii]TYC09839.1 hypothetical protein FXF65_32485 [Actinomadura syzygii]
MTVRLSAVIMHHPRRAALLPGLLRSCAPLAPRVIEDPRPGGPPSALRTAKRAWASITADATHHLVLQDDVVPVPGFARELTEAIAHRPGFGLALCVNWNSPHNSYLTRKAAMAGRAWAPLSRYEWTPTLGLVLPVREARALAEHLSRLPDDAFWGDDDEAIIDFRNRRGLPMTATIPHLVDHTDHPSLAGNDLDGSRHGTVLAPGLRLPPGHWADSPDEAGFTGGPHEFTVELRGSRCLIRFVRPGADEYVSHPYGWYWHDWCGVAGFDPDTILDGFADFLSSGLVAGGVTVAEATEVWAAGYLLGADLARSGARPVADGPVRAALRTAALESWIDSGLRARPAADARAAYAAICAAGCARGSSDHSGAACPV